MRRVGATSAAAGLALASALGSASAASAAPELETGDIWSDPVVWTQVGDDATIDDAYFQYEQSESAGWTQNAFDRVGVISVEVCEDVWVSVNGDDDADAVVPVESGTGFSTGYTWNDVSSVECPEASIDVNVGLGLTANVAAWVVSAPGAEAISFSGRVGSEEPSFDTVVEDAQFLQYDDNGNSPSQLWTFAGATETDTVVSYDDGLQDFGAEADGEALVAAVVIADYANDPSAQDEANDYLLGLAPAYMDGSGAALPLFFGDVLPKLPAVTATAGASIAETLELDPATTGFFEDWGYSDGDLQWVVQGLPEGLTLNIGAGEDGLPVFALSGIPVTAGDYEATVWFSFVDEDGEFRAQYPLPVALSIDVEPVIVPAADDMKELAETGADSLPLVGGSVALLLFGGLALVATRRRAARSEG